MAKILITGANGLLGVNFCDRASLGHDVLGLVRAEGFHPPYPTARADLFDEQAVGKVLDTYKPNIIVHTAAMADLDQCEKHPETAWKANADLPGKLSTAAYARGIKFIHISTDAVFTSDSDHVFNENDEVSPVSVYARTKYAGERSVLNANPDALVARVNFFGWSISGSRSLAEFFYNHLSAKKACSGFTDVYFCPLFVNDLTDMVLLAAERGLKGLYHVTGSEILSKYDFGVTLAKEFGLDPSLISPKSVELSTLTAKRSNNLRMSNHKLSTDLNMSIPGVSTGIHGFYTQFQQSYPQKIQTYQQVERRS